MKKNQLFSFNLIDEENSSEWSKDFFKSYNNGDKESVMNLLKQADKLYLDEYYIFNSIVKLNSNSTDNSNKDTILEGLKKCRLIKGIVKNDNTISINAGDVSIKTSKLSDILSEVNFDSRSKDEVLRKSIHSAEYISQLLSFPNSIVTGYVYGIADKAKSIRTWVEFRNNKNQEFVIDYENNTVLNKEGFYFIRHAEPIKKVSSDDIKGKSSVGKFISFNSINESVEPEIEFDFDMDFDR